VGSYDLAALLIVFAIPVVLLGVAALAFFWAHDSLQRSLPVGAIGVLGTLVAAGNLFVERSCAGSVNRPIITAVLGPDECRRSALVALEVVVLLAVATALVVRAGEVRVRR
jgi:hypothetical protein